MAILLNSWSIRSFTSYTTYNLLLTLEFYLSLWENLSCLYSQCGWSREAITNNTRGLLIIKYLINVGDCFRFPMYSTEAMKTPSLGKPILFLGIWIIYPHSSRISFLSSSTAWNQSNPWWFITNSLRAIKSFFPFSKNSNRLQRGQLNLTNYSISSFSPRGLINTRGTFPSSNNCPSCPFVLLRV